MTVITRVVHRFNYPAEAPVLSITFYYLALMALFLPLMYFVPSLRQMVSGERLAELASKGNPFTDSSPIAGETWLSWHLALSLGLAMLGAVLLMIPTSWVYMATRRRKGFDQSVVQTMVILALSVAGVIVIVRNSVALAFSLAGVVGAVRFRNTLPDTRDTLYIFLAIGVGMAAGVDALLAALVLSAIFNYTILILWRSDYGMCELGKSQRELLLTAPAKLDQPSGDTTPVLRLTQPQIVPATDKGNGKQKKKDSDFNAVLLVRTKSVEPTKPVVEEFLTRETKRWRLAEQEGNGRETVLKYLVRMGKKQQPGDVEDALLAVGSPHVIGARIH